MTPHSTEADFQRAVTDLLDTLGLRYWHDNDSRRNKAGLPDLIIVCPAGVLWRELKTERGRVTSEQREWLTDLHSAGQDADVWRPRDLDTGRIARELQALRTRKETA